MIKLLKLKRRLVSLLFFSVFLVLYFSLYFILPQVLPYKPELAPVVLVEEEDGYRGLLIDQLPESLQKKEASCGHAALVYLLDLYSICSTEQEIEEVTGLEGWLSFYDMATFTESKNLRWQAVEVNKKDFFKNSVPSILHVKWGHFVTFIEIDERGNVLIFDPARGLVLLSKKNLQEIWDGYFFYVYL